MVKLNNIVFLFGVLILGSTSQVAAQDRGRKTKSTRDKLASAGKLLRALTHNKNCNVNERHSAVFTLATDMQEKCEGFGRAVSQLSPNDDVSKVAEVFISFLSEATVMAKVGVRACWAGVEQHEATVDVDVAILGSIVDATTSGVGALDLIDTSSSGGVEVQAVQEAVDDFVKNVSLGLSKFKSQVGTNASAFDDVSRIKKILTMVKMLRRWRKGTKIMIKAVSPLGDARMFVQLDDALSSFIDTSDGIAA
jgi:hypothetical protein